MAVRFLFIPLVPLRKLNLLAQISPYKSGDSKKSQVTRMFDNISGSYDFLNRFLSLGIDKGWRHKALKSLNITNSSDCEILDVASGTCDLAIEAIHQYPDIKVIAIDISEQMLQKGLEKIKSGKLDQQISIAVQDAENISYADNRFDAVMIAFGVRNFENLNKGLSEMRRVLKPGGKMVILEFSQPRHFPVKQVFKIYFKYVLPFIGNLLSKDSRAYTYLFESVQHFPDYERFTAILEQEGLRECSFKPLTFGICTIYLGTK
jgi:demethylmenaquinone methyltransferase/2-methoxy-6-polyprenyl-1,4-benzoquinol methylase